MRERVHFLSLRRAILALAIGSTLAAGGCSRPVPVLAPKANQRPVLELTRAPFNESTRFEYSYRMNWLGYDPDGRVEYYLYAIDPPSPTTANPFPETTWVSTDKSERLVTFSASLPDTIRENEDGSADFHTFVVKAIDNGGAGGPLQSVPLVRSFFTYTIAPTVQIISPAPSDRGRAYVPPSVRIHWTGSDEDGILNNKKPNQYKYILLTQNSEVPFQLAITNPDSVRRYYAPRHWAGWDSTGADTTFKQYNDLVPGQDYLFCVIAIDEAGAYSPIFNLNTNMLNMRVTYAAQGGPRLTVFNDIFFFQYIPAVYSSLPQYQIRVEFPASELITINWSAETDLGVELRGTRWALDIEDLSDNTPRTNERTDLAHWSQWSALNTSATIGPFRGGEVHFFYIEAEDNNGLRSLATINMSIVQSSFEKPLLVITDTRLKLDERSSSIPCINPPTQRWPWSAELDTFLFARGGFPWRCFPAGTITPPGIFAGYEFDTLGTRTGQSVVRVPLAKIGRYRHLVWITDASAAIKSDPGTSLSESISALRYMSVPGRANSIAAYIKQGGEVWLLGGGAAYASLIPYNRINNDTQHPAPGTTFSFVNNELIQGRFMYDVFHWQSEIKAIYSPVSLVGRFFGRHDSSGVVPLQYRNLPPVLRPKSAALGDAFPPNRSLSPGNFYLANFDVEYLSQPNRILEDVDPSLLGFDEQSTLDTLYRAAGVSLVQPQFNAYNVCMTRYVGPAYPHVIFTGFNIWNRARVDCKQLVDVVLRDFWGLPYTPPAAARLAASPRRSE
ncbi:MAG: hypothetical protein ABIS67_14980 [Candidatus Eisenbacteria bacterium]